MLEIIESRFISQIDLGAANIEITEARHQSIEVVGPGHVKGLLAYFRTQKGSMTGHQSILIEVLVDNEKFISHKIDKEFKVKKILALPAYLFFLPRRIQTSVTVDGNKIPGPTLEISFPAPF